MNYDEFLKSKVISAPESGFDVEPERMNGSLFEWQRDIVRWSLKKGKAAYDTLDEWKSAQRGGD